MSREERGAPRDTPCPSVMEVVEAGSVTSVERTRLVLRVGGGAPRTGGGGRKVAVTTTSALAVSRRMRWVAAETVVVNLSLLSGPGGGRSSGGR